MNCYYYIKLPNGGDIRFPSTLQTLTDKESEELKNLLTNYKKTVKDSVTELNSFLKLKTNFKGSTETIWNKISRNNAEASDQEVSEFIESLNTFINQSGTYLGLVDSAKQLAFKTQEIEQLFGDTWTKVSLFKIIKELNKSIDLNYFATADIDTILGGKSYKTIIEDIKLEQMQLDVIGVDSKMIKNLNLLLSSLFENKDSNRVKNIFFESNFKSDSAVGENDSLLVLNEGRLPMIFYQANSRISLHFALLKLLGIKNLTKNPQALITVIQQFNKVAGKDNQISESVPIEEFFNGTFNNDERTDPEFYKMLKFKYGEESLKSLIKIMVENGEYTEPNKIEKALNTIIDLMDFDKLSTFNKLADLKNSNHAQQLEQNINAEQIQVKNILPLFTYENKPYHYGVPTKSEVLTSGNDINNFLNSKIRKGVDVIQVKTYDPLSDHTIDRYITPIYWSVINDGIYVRGWYSQNGTVTEYKGKILTDKEVTITYSKFVTKYKEPQYTSNVFSKITNPLIIKNNFNNSLPVELLQKLIIRGSYIEYRIPSGTRTGNVKNTFPGGIELNTVYSGTESFNPRPKFEDILVIHTDPELIGAFNIAEIIASLPSIKGAKNKDEAVNDSLIGKSHEIVNNLAKWGNNVPIHSGDWVDTGTATNSLYNLVVGSSNDIVYILIQSAKGSRIEQVPIKDIRNVYKEKVEFDRSIYAELSELYDESTKERSIRNSQYSIFTDRFKLQNGDYIWSPSSKSVLQVINSDKKEYIKYSIIDGNSAISYETEIPQDAIFFTKNNIATGYFGMSIDFNNFKLDVVTEMPVIEGMTVNEVQLEEKIYIVPKDVVITPDLLLNSNNLQLGRVQQKGFPFDQNLYRDATAELIALINKTRKTKGKFLVAHKIKNYYVRYDSNLYETEYSIEKEQFLQPYNYITLKASVGEGHKYRIISRENNILQLEYNTFNMHGKVITVNKYLDLNKEGDKINRLYVMFKNDKLPSLKKLDVKTNEKNQKISAIARQNNITEVFHNLYDIDVYFEAVTEKTPSNEIKKAFIKSASGKNSIIVNTLVTDSEKELLHEYLHLFLAATKYSKKDMTLYESLLTRYLEVKKLPTTNVNWNEVEETFVNEINKSMWEHNTNDIMNIVNVDTFLEIFEKILKSLDVIAQDDITFSKESGTFESVFSILDFKMNKIDAFNKISKSSKKNTNVLYFDSNFKAWISSLIEGKDGNNKLIINCK